MPESGVASIQVWVCLLISLGWGGGMIWVVGIYVCACDICWLVAKTCIMFNVS